MGPLWKGELHGYYAMMVERMESQPVPENFDGIFRATTK
jgi:hypothetical protein